MNAQPKDNKEDLQGYKPEDVQPLNTVNDNKGRFPMISQRYIYHITDRDNLASIVRLGLICAPIQRKLAKEEGLQVKHLPRFFEPHPYVNRIVIPGDKKTQNRIDDCVQFVFTAKDPRLFDIINSKNIDQDRIIFLCMRGSKITELGGCVSDRFAKAPDYEPGEGPRFYSDLSEADKVLDWGLIDSSKMGTKDSELKITLTNWPKTAQAFFPERVDFSEIEAIIVFDDAVKVLIQDQLISLGIDLDQIKIYTEKEASASLPSNPKFYWYKEHIIGHEKESLVTGPRELYNLYKECISEIKENRKRNLSRNNRNNRDNNANKDRKNYGSDSNSNVDTNSDISTNTNSALCSDSNSDDNTDSNSISSVIPYLGESVYRFENVESLVGAIEEDFCVLPELKGIYRLPTDTQAHHEDVGAHTLTTVRNLVHSKYYQNADEHLKNVIKLSAYLHDIGKGPRQKWPEQIQHRYPDHPRDSISMLKRILSDEIKNLSDKDIHDICLMVIYHDVVGECQNKGRSYQEVANIVQSEEDLHMLYCISEADIRAINDAWYDKFMSLEQEFREDILRMKDQSKEVLFP